MSNALLVLLAIIALSFAKANAGILPLETLRSQGNSDHCWAYSTNHVISSHVQYAQNMTLSLDMENDLMYWVYYNRFIERYRKGAPLDEFKDVELSGEDGFPAEFWTKFIRHGQQVYSVQYMTASEPVAYPTLPKSHHPFMNYKKPKGDKLDALALVAKLEVATNEAQASQIILETLDKSIYARSDEATKWFGKLIPVDQVAQRVLKNDYATLSQDELVWVFETKEPKELHHWESYYNGRYKNYYMSTDEISALIKKSVDNGYGFEITIREGGYEDHIMAGIGYDGDHVLVADSEAPHYYWTTFSNVESVMVFKSAVGTLLPASHDWSLPPSKTYGFVHSINSCTKEHRNYFQKIVFLFYSGMRRAV